MSGSETASPGTSVSVLPPVIIDITRAPPRFGVPPPPPDV
jgi:hypothetical protein